MPIERHPGHAIVGFRELAGRHGGQGTAGGCAAGQLPALRGGRLPRLCRGLPPALRAGGSTLSWCEGTRITSGCVEYLPQCSATLLEIRFGEESIECAGHREMPQGTLVEVRAMHEILDGPEWSFSPCRLVDLLRFRSQPVDQAKTETEIRRLILGCPRAQRAAVVRRRSGRRLSGPKGRQFSD